MPAPHQRSESGFDEAYASFLTEFPDYEKTLALDTLRARDFRQLDDQGHIYLDYTGGGLFSETQIERHTQLLRETVFGNPHSTNPTSQGTTERVEACRRRVLQFFRASPDEYAVIFTANASHSLKLVGESYPFGAGDRFLLTFDNHNSVNGIREFDRLHGAETTYLPVTPPDMRVDPDCIDDYLDLARPGGHNLFAFPAQSNFSGVQHDLDWIARAQAKGWDVLLDAAAYVPTNRLDLGRWHPDFVALSFYKMFGHPTGIGALIARHEALEKLCRPWFAGGTIEVASVQADTHYLASGSARFEDGTVDYTNIPAVHIGLDFLDGVGLELIHARVHCLTGYLLRGLLGLRHGSGRRVVHLYGPADLENRGGTVTVNFADSDGAVIDHEIIEEQANEKLISLRTGCFCNPGAGEMALGISREELDTCFSGADDVMTYDAFRHCIDGKSTGAVRVSVGLASNFADVEAFLRFAAGFRRP